MLNYYPALINVAVKFKERGREPEEGLMKKTNRVPVEGGPFSLTNTSCLPLLHLPQTLRVLNSQELEPKERENICRSCPPPLAPAATSLSGLIWEPGASAGWSLLAVNFLPEDKQIKRASVTQPSLHRMREAIAKATCEVHQLEEKLQGGPFPSLLGDGASPGH